MKRGIINLNDVVILFVLFFIGIIIFALFLVQRASLDGKQGRLNFAGFSSRTVPDFVLSAYLRQRFTQDISDFAQAGETLPPVPVDGLPATMQDALIQLLDDKRCLEWLAGEGKPDDVSWTDVRPRMPSLPPSSGVNAQSALCRAVYEYTFAFFRSFTKDNFFLVTVSKNGETFNLGYPFLKGENKCKPGVLPPPPVSSSNPSSFLAEEQTQFHLSSSDGLVTVCLIYQRLII